ncbi:MAG TPA: amidohydrolase family protein [Anaerolineales bacterium]|nr:amidohydrolase family protein [Anaerolineales bacterium]
MADLIIDTHVHPKMGAAALLAEMDSAGVQRSVLLAVDTDPNDLRDPQRLRETRLRFFKTPEARQVLWSEIETTMLQKLTPKVTNQIAADMVTAHPDRFIGLGSINLSKDAAYVAAKLEEIERLGLQGIKLLPFSQFFDPAESENFRRVCDWSQKNGRVILIHTGCGAPPWDARAFSLEANPEKLRPALELYPEAHIIMAHMGSYSKDEPGIWFEEACKLGAEFPNLYGDLAAVAWLVEREKRVVRMRETIGFKRILFASDYPAVANQVSIRYMIDLVRNNPFLTEDEKLDILGRNAARLFEIA